MQIVVSDFYHANSLSVVKCSAAVSLNWAPDVSPYVIPMVRTG